MMTAAGVAALLWTTHAAAAMTEPPNWLPQSLAVFVAEFDHDLGHPTRYSDLFQRPAHFGPWGVTRCSVIHDPSGSQTTCQIWGLPAGVTANLMMTRVRGTTTEVAISVQRNSGSALLAAITSELLQLNLIQATYRRALYRLPTGELVENAIMDKLGAAGASHNGTANLRLRDVQLYQGMMFGDFVFNMDWLPPK